MVLPPTAVTLLPQHTWSEKAKDFFGRTGMKDRSQSTGLSDAVQQEVNELSILQSVYANLLILQFHLRWTVQLQLAEFFYKNCTSEHHVWRWLAKKVN